MFGAAKALHRIVAGAVITSTVLLRSSASNALDSITLIIEWAYQGRHAYFFEALDRGYYRDAGLEVKIVRGQGSMEAIRQVGAGNAMFGFIDVGSLILARANDQIPVKLVAIVYRQPPQAIYCREDSGLKNPRTWRAMRSLNRPVARLRPFFRPSPKPPASMLERAVGRRKQRLNAGAIQNDAAYAVDSKIAGGLANGGVGT
jgi:ABC-type nitrate/sulfonate/bicarbonate transport system substrate-binding protein